MKETDQTGRCYCGAVRYTIRAPSTWCAHVHHEGLSRLFGAPSVALTSVRRDRLSVEGALTTFSGGPAPFTHRQACATCGTALFVSTGAEEICVASATLDGEPLRVPSASLWADQARPWAPPHPKLPAFGGEDGSAPLGIADRRARLNLAQTGVRLATRWDRFDLEELASACAAELGGPPPAPTLEARLHGDQHWLLVAEADRQPCGFCDLALLEPATGSAQLVIHGLYVAGVHRRRGLARGLLDAARWLARECDAPRLSYSGPSPSAAGVAFLAAAGFAAPSKPHEIRCLDVQA